MQCITVIQKHLYYYLPKITAGLETSCVNFVIRAESVARAPATSLCASTEKLVLFSGDALFEFFASPVFFRLFEFCSFPCGQKLNFA